MKSSRLLLVLLALVAPVLTAFAPGDDFPSSSPPPQVCSIYDTTAYAGDHIAWELGQCWESWTRPPNECTHTSVHTFWLDDSADHIVFNAADAPDAINPANTPAKCAGRRLTLRVERELKRAPGVWSKIADYTEYGQWDTSTSQCYVYLGWKSVAISTGTGRVRLTAQITRSNGTYAGTTTVAGYIIPGAMEPCIEIPD
jgi:hypothetical protein